MNEMPDKSGLSQQYESTFKEIHQQWGMYSSEALTIPKLRKVLQDETGLSTREIGSVSLPQLLELWRGIVDEPKRQLVSLNQIAAIVQRKPKTLRNQRSGGKMPQPDVRGKRGQPHFWDWERIRPWAESEFNRKLPERFPRI